MSEIAKLCQVSQTVVSRALANHPGVNVKTREKIVKVAKQYNYRPNALVRSLKRGATLTIAIACNAIKDEYAGGILQHLVEKLQTRGYDSLIFNWDLSVDNHTHLLQRISERRADALLMFPPAKIPDNEYMHELRAFARPVILLDQNWPGREYDYVGFDNYAGAALQTEHLISLGHNNLGCIYCDSISSGQERRDGFISTMIKHGLTVKSEWLCEYNAEQSELQLCKIYQEYLSQESRPSGIVCFNDRAAALLVKTALSLGFSVPEQLSVIGFADLSFASYLSPALTTVSQDPSAVAESTIELLFKRVKQIESIIKPELIKIPVQLIVRDSTASVINN